MWTNEVLKSQKTKMSVTYDNKIYIDSTFVCIYVHIYTEREGERDRDRDRDRDRVYKMKRSTLVCKW